LAKSFKTKIIILFSLILITGGIGYFANGVYFHSEETITVSSAESTSQPVLASIESAVEAKSVCLVPGHGGDDPGAERGTLEEKEINLTVALQVRTLLEQKGYIVYMSRETNDITMFKQARIDFCNNTGASIMVAIHHNTYSDRSVDYGTALYYKKSDQALADSILKATSAQLGIKNAGISKFEDRELYDVSMPAVVTEAFFMTNTSEYNQIIKTNSTRLADEARAISDGIISYFLNPSPEAPILSSEPLVIDRLDLE